MSGFNYSEIRKRAAAAMGVVKGPKPLLSQASNPDEENVSLDTILAATEKLLAVNRGEAEPDERDSWSFKKVMTPDKLFAERIKMDSNKIRRVAMRRLAKARTLKPIGVDHFGDYAMGLVVGHPLSSPLEEINVMSLAEQARRITGMGPGGVGSSDSITPEMQSNHPSQFGFISATEGPECHSSDTLVYTRLGWVPWPEVKPDASFACQIDGRLEFHKAERIISECYDGEMIGVKSQDFDFLVTPNHRMLARRARRGSPYVWSEVKEQFNSCWLYPTAHAPFVADGDTRFELPFLTKASNSQKIFPKFEMTDWAGFMGYWLAEGSLSKSAGTCYDTTRISKNADYDPEVNGNIAALLDRMDISWNYQSSTGDFFISGKQLANYLEQFGHSGDKFIPEYFFSQSVATRKELLKSLMETDSRVNATHKVYTSTSKRLALDVQRLMISLGFPTNFREEPDSRPHVKSTNWCACLLKTTARTSGSGTQYRYWRKENYAGVVYCATVPGGMLFTRRGRGVGFWSGNSERAGVDVRLSHNARVGSDGKVYQQFHNRKTDKLEWVSPDMLHGKVVGLPE